MSNSYMARRELTVKEFRAFVNDTGYQTDADRSGGGLIIERRGGVQVRRDPVGRSGLIF